MTAAAFAETRSRIGPITLLRATFATVRRHILPLAAVWLAWSVVAVGRQALNTRWPAEGQIDAWARMLLFQTVYAGLTAFVLRRLLNDERGRFHPDAALAAFVAVTVVLTLVPSAVEYGLGLLLPPTEDRYLLAIRSMSVRLAGSLLDALLVLWTTGLLLGGPARNLPYAVRGLRGAFVGYVVACILVSLLAGLPAGMVYAALTMGAASFAEAAPAASAAILPIGAIGTVMLVVVAAELFRARYLASASIADTFD